VAASLPSLRLTMDAAYEFTDFRSAIADRVSIGAERDTADSQLDRLALCIAGVSGVISGALFVWLGLFVRSLHGGTVPGYALIALGFAAPVLGMVGMAACQAPKPPSPFSDHSRDNRGGGERHL
jgi:hypothetical protein